MASAEIQDADAANEWQVVTRRRRSKKQSAVEPSASRVERGPSAPDGIQHPVKKLPASEQEPSPKDSPPTVPLPPAHPQDSIYRQALNAIITHNRRSLANFTDPLRIYIFDQIPTKFGKAESNTMPFLLAHRQEGSRIHCKLIRKNATVKRIDALVCEVGGESMRFDHWLEGWKLPVCILVGERGYDQQCRWWSKTGKTFELMKLPVELRQTVFEHLLPIYVYAGLHRRDTLTNGTEIIVHKFGEGSEDPILNSGPQNVTEKDPTRKIVPKPDLALATTSKQLNAEVEEWMWKQTTKCFLKPKTLRNFLRCHLPDPKRFNSLRFLELDFSHEAYILMFEVDLPPFKEVKEFGEHDFASTLPALTCVEEFHLRFKSPFDAMLQDPWGLHRRLQRASVVHGLAWPSGRRRFHYVLPEDDCRLDPNVR